ncbi:MAG: AAA family ATPase, partial [Myxococcota bacterium]|nr:AAA family ATPase [Myxococcota bacterium]
MEVADALWIAAGLTRRVRELNDARVVHRELNPHTVLVNSETREVDLMTHASSSRIPRETGQLVHPGHLEGALEYISPEQTGRMNRAIDYRTDFYSLGATLYHMLGGAPPFSGEDPVEVVHSHIARAPLPPEAPGVLSALVLKLLAKNAEDRYQSAAGVIEDLETCARRLEERGQLDAFELGRGDVTERVQVPQKLYGREAELERLGLSLRRVSQGHPEVVLVSGYPGIGKTALVQEMQRPILESRGILVSGKADMLQRNVPYHTVARAFSRLLRRLLTERGEELARWRGRL